MNENINLCEILKDTPKGTKFYTPLIGEVEFNEIKYNTIYVRHNGVGWCFNSKGQYLNIEGAECLLFPSKDQRDWSKYQRPFKDGDILTTKLGSIFIYHYSKLEEMSNKSICCAHIAINSTDKTILNNDEFSTYMSMCSFATEEEKQKLFQAIKNNGYKWNNQTKKLEMLITPNFKIGDIIQDKNSYKVKITAINEDGFYEYESLIAKGIGTITFKDQYDWELIEYQVRDHFIHPSNPELFVITEIRSYGNYKIQRLRGSSYVINKHDLRKYTKVNKWDSKWLKPFDKVLVRNYQDTTWRATLFSHIGNTKEFPYVTSYASTKYCIPYNDETKHLVGTTLEEPEFYKL